MSESMRGCGFRSIGGMYLCSSAGKTVYCDALPLPIVPCGCCGYEVPFSRGFQWITKDYLTHLSKEKHGGKGCTCNPFCQVCYPHEERYGLMWVGNRYYTPESFVDEAVKMGVSKRIPEIPKGLVFGETWVLTAHLKVPDHKIEPNGGLLTKEPKTMKAVFYAFKPDRVEMPLWKDEVSNEMILKLEKRGITPVLLEKTPENLKRHKVSQRKAELLRYIDKTTSLEEEEEQ